MSSIVVKNTKREARLPDLIRVSILACQGMCKVEIDEQLCFSLREVLGYTHLDVGCLTPAEVLHELNKLLHFPHLLLLQRHGDLVCLLSRLF